MKILKRIVAWLASMLIVSQDTPTGTDAETELMTPEAKSLLGDGDADIFDKRLAIITAEYIMMRDDGMTVFECEVEVSRRLQARGWHQVELFWAANRWTRNTYNQVLIEREQNQQEESQ